MERSRLLEVPERDRVAILIDSIQDSLLKTVLLILSIQTLKSIPEYRRNCPGPYLTSECNPWYDLVSWLDKRGDPMKDKTIYTTRELADLAAQYGRPVTQEYVRRLCKAGRIQAIRPSRDWLISASEAMRWLASWLKS